MANKVNELKKEVVKYAKLLDEKGLVNTTEGNIRRIEERTENVDFVLSTILLKTEKYTVYQIHPHLGLPEPSGLPGRDSLYRI